MGRSKWIPFLTTRVQVASFRGVRTSGSYGILKEILPPEPTIIEGGANDGIHVANWMDHWPKAEPSLWAGEPFGVAGGKGWPEASGLTQSLELGESWKVGKSESRKVGFGKFGRGSGRKSFGSLPQLKLGAWSWELPKPELWLSCRHGSETGSSGRPVPWRFFFFS